MNIAAIFAGGIGSRMGSSVPKQFLEIYGKPIIVHTLEKFQYNDKVDLIYVGCKEEYISLLESLVKKYNLNKIKVGCILEGGKSGLETIYKILEKIYSEHSDSYVLIHDGVRPNITENVIDENIDMAHKYGNAITVVPNFETPIICENGQTIDKTLNRNIIYTAKAPQTFKVKEIFEAYKKVYKKYKTFEIDGIVDSCSIALSVGMKLNIVEGNRDNIKVTTESDYIEILGRLVFDDYFKFFSMKNN